MNYGMIFLVLCLGASVLSLLMGAYYYWRERQEKDIGKHRQQISNANVIISLCMLVTLFISWSSPSVLNLWLVSSTIVIILVGMALQIIYLVFVTLSSRRKNSQLQKVPPSSSVGFISKEDYLKELLEDRLLKLVRILYMDEPMELDKVYVPASFYWWQSRRNMEFQSAASPQSKHEGDIPEEWLVIRQRDPLAILEKERHLVLLGDPGTGKTTYLKHLARHLAATEKGKKIPCYIELREFAALAHPTDLLEFVAKKVSQSHRSYLQPAKDFLRNALEEKRLLLLLDGFDEALMGDGRREIKDSLRKISKCIVSLIQQAPHVQIIVTSRRDIYEQEASPLRHHHFYELYLKGFEQRGVTQYINNWFTLRPSEAEADKKLIIALQQNQRLAQIARNPLFLTLLTKLYEDFGDEMYLAKLASNPGEFYRQCIHALLEGKWDYFRGVDRLPDFESSLKRKLLSLIAWEYQARGQYRFPKKDTLDITRKYLSKLDRRPLFGASEKDILAELCERDNLLHVVGQDKDTQYYEFLHPTFQEYFAAQYALQEYPPDSQEMKSCINNPYWEDALYLYAAGIKNVRPLLRELLEEQKDDIFCSNLIQAAHCLSSFSGDEREQRLRIVSRLKEKMRYAPYKWTKARSAAALAEIRATAQMLETDSDISDIEYDLIDLLIASDDLLDFPDIVRRITLFLGEEKVARRLLHEETLRFAWKHLKKLENKQASLYLRDPMRGCRAARILGMLNAPFIVPELLERLQIIVLHEEVARAIVMALGECDQSLLTPKQTHELLDTLLAMLNDERFVRIMYDIVDALLQFASNQEHRKQIVSALRDKLAGDQRILHMHVYSALLALDETEVISELLKSLSPSSDDEWSVHSVLVEIWSSYIKDYGLSPAAASLLVRALIPRFASTDEPVDKRISSSLASIMGKTARNADDYQDIARDLVSLLEDREIDPHSRASIALTLGQLGIIDIRPDLRRIADSEQLPEEVCVSITIALCQLEDHSATQQFLKNLDTWEIRGEDTAIEGQIFHAAEKLLYRTSEPQQRRELIERFRLFPFDQKYRKDVRRNFLKLIEQFADDRKTCSILTEQMRASDLRDSIFVALWKISRRAVDIKIVEGENKKLLIQARQRVV